MRIQTTIEFLEKLPKPFLTLFGYLLVLAISSLGTFISRDTSLSLFYLLPIILIAWFEGVLPATMISLFSAINCAMSDLLSGRIYSNFAVPVWNAATMLGMFLIVAYSITAARKLFVKEREHARTDDLTGAANIRFFYEQARVEISRSALHKLPLTLAYISLDNLKHVNDTQGHVAGDYLLHEVAQTMRLTLRPADIIARFGGAEFAILIPETKNEDAVVALHKLQGHLLGMVKKKGWPITFSTGVVTCDGPAYTMVELITIAEDLMHVARETGKNFVKSKVVNLSSTAP